MDPSNPNSSNLVVPRKYKFVFLGDQSVGKTSIITRYCNDKYDPDSDPTIGVDFIMKTLHIDGESIRLQLWDTAGQERFRVLIPSYIKDSSVAIIVFDITNRQSFENVNKWVKDVRDERGDDAIIALVGNKTDLDEDGMRQVKTEEGVELARELDVMYVEVSAKTGDNISTIFNNTAQILLGFEITKMEDNEDAKNKQENPTINLNQAQQQTQNNPIGSKGCNC